MRAAHPLRRPTGAMTLRNPTNYGWATSETAKHVPRCFVLGGPIMTARYHHVDRRPSDRTPLPRPVQEHLGRQLRAAYRAAEPPPAYLGDPALPSTFDDVVRRLASREGAPERAGARGLSAVRVALQDLLFAAQLAKH